MNKHTSHITINGKPLCHHHKYLFHDKDVHGNRIACGFTDHKKAKAVCKYLRDHVLNGNVRLKGGPCPIQGD